MKLKKLLVVVIAIGLLLQITVLTNAEESLTEESVINKEMESEEFNLEKNESSDISTFASKSNILFNIYGNQIIRINENSVYKLNNNNNNQKIESIKYYTSDKSIASLTQNGEEFTLVGLKTGSVTVYGDVTYIDENGCYNIYTACIDVCVIEEVKYKDIVTCKDNNINIGSGNSLDIYESSNPEIATVDDKGNIYTVNSGKVSISLSRLINGEKVLLEVTNLVVNPSVEIALNAENVELYVGETFEIVPIVTNGDITEMKSKDDKIASVAINGVVKAISKGTTEIVVTAKNACGEKTSKITINVKENIVPEPKPTIKNYVEIKNDLNICVGSKSQSPEITVPSNASIKYESENPGIAVVDENGNVTGISEGTTKIYVTSILQNAENATKSYLVNVKNKTEEIINKDAITINKGNISTVYIATNGSKKITYYSENDGIVSVDENGKITAIEVGATTVYAVIESECSIIKVKIPVCVIDKNDKEIEETEETTGNSEKEVEYEESKVASEVQSYSRYPLGYLPQTGSILNVSLIVIFSVGLISVGILIFVKKKKQ